MTTTAIIQAKVNNPYLIPWRSQLASQLSRDEHNIQNSDTRISIHPPTMGIQSQRREGAIAKCKKRASKHKIVKHIINGSTSFDPLIHCRVCQARTANKVAGKLVVRLPKRPHHPRCSKNRKTKGLSKSRTCVGDENPKNEVIAAPHTNLTLTSNVNNYKANFKTFPMVNSTTPVTTGNLADPTNLRKELDSRMERLDSEFSWAMGQKFPPALGVLIDYICTSFEHRKPCHTNAKCSSTISMQNAMAIYRQFFIPGSLSFTFPREMNDESNNTSPHYHALEGTSFFLVDWKLAFPSVELHCYCCNGHLDHDRTNFSKNKSLFPLWTNSGRPKWCVIMVYKCQQCKMTFAGNDGRLLSLMNRDISSVYPVDPVYASGTFHFDQDLSDNLESLMRTYANAKFVSDKLYRKLGQEYERKAHTYLCRSPKEAFVSRNDFIGTVMPPSSHAIRQYFKNAEYSELKPYGYSNFERYEREMQSVEVKKGEKIAFDWTFQTVKNYVLKGAKAIFTGNKGSTKEIITALIVPSTKAEHASHGLLESCQKREEFQPGIVYTDTCPHNDAFWKKIFGSEIETRLGLFHLMHRMVETLDSHSELYWKCLNELKLTVYQYNEEDEVSLLAALKNGSFSGKKLTDDEIRQLRHSKKWKQRYNAFLRKIIHPTEKIQYLLSQ